MHNLAPIATARAGITMETVDRLGDLHPDVMRLVYPRRYHVPSGYFNPKAYAASLGGAIIVGRHLHGPANLNGTVNASALVFMAMRLIEFDIPTYFVAPDFLQAMLATNPPDDLTLDELNWPMPAMLFALPADIMRSTVGFEVPFLSVAKFDGGIYRMPDPIRRLNSLPGIFQLEEPKFASHFPCYIQGHPVDYESVMSMRKQAKDLFGLKDFVFDTTKVLLPPHVKELTPEQEDALARKMNSIAISLLLAMDCNPEFIEGQCLHRPAKIKNGVLKKDALWSPHFIGRRYVIQQEHGPGLGGTHASPRMHWRWGHYRQQPFGRGRLQRKRIRIEPVLVNAAVGEI